MKTIVVIDFSLQGHHLSFMRSFCKILLEQGNKVVCIVPEPEQVVSWINTEASGKQQFFIGHIYSYKPLLATKYGRFNETIKALHRWKEEARMIRDVERQYQLKTELVFYAWLDYQLAPYIPSFV